MLRFRDWLGVLVSIWCIYPSMRSPKLVLCSENVLVYVQYPCTVLLGLSSKCEANIKSSGSDFHYLLNLPCSYLCFENMPGCIFLGDLSSSCSYLSCHSVCQMEMSHPGTLNPRTEWSNAFTLVLGLSPKSPAPSHLTSPSPTSPLPFSLFSFFSHSFCCFPSPFFFLSKLKRFFF